MDSRKKCGTLIKPVLYEANELANLKFENIINSIGEFSYSKEFSPVKGSPQKEQNLLTKALTESLNLHLQEKNTLYTFETEKKTSNFAYKDSVDIFGENDCANIIIELDSNRADQVAKKFVSRAILSSNKSLLYISYCYGGTKAMEKNENEVLKYFKYCSILATRMGFGYAAFIGK